MFMMFIKKLTEKSRDATITNRSQHATLGQEEDKNDKTNKQMHEKHTDQLPLPKAR